jgi:Plasmid encoded RepA protein
MLDFFRLSKDGRHYRRIVQGFQRVFAATIFFGTDDQPGGNHVADWTRFHFFDRIQLWFHDHDQSAPTDDVPENTIILSEAFYQEIDAHRIPVEREVIATLAHAPGILDFYIWVVWKTWTMNGQPAYIPILSPGGLSEQLGSKTYSVGRTFRLVLSKWIRRVKALWPECPVVISEDGNFLVLRSSRRSPAINSVQRALSR